MVITNEGWAGWLMEGDFIAYTDHNGDRKYYHVDQRDWAHYVYTWSGTVATETSDGPQTIENMIPTLGGHLWQIIWGIKPDIYGYINVPTGTFRHGIPKQTQPTTTFRTVAHYTHDITPFDTPR